MSKILLFRSGTIAAMLCAAAICSAAEIAPPAKTFTAGQRAYWAFQPVRSGKPPAVRSAAWVRNPIDAFILHRLEAKGIQPGPDADKRTLLRRVSFDLIGMPPTREEVDAFLADKSPDAYERVVDRLLASPHYGERWARHWLDVARYAESDGFRADEYRQNVWRYRDYVIKSFNADKGYDRFVQEQIAGDEMWPNDPEARVATAFSRHYPDEWNARDLQQRRQEILQDITDAVGSAFMGLTVGCAKCHDHKFDPILHRDYYRLQAFFAHTANDDNVAMWAPEEQAEQARKSEEWDRATAKIREEMDALLKEARQSVIDEEYFKFPDEVKNAVAKAPEQRTPFEQQLAHRAKVITEPSLFLAVPKLKGDRKKRYEELRAELARFDHLYHADRPVGAGMRDLGPVAPKTHVLAVGNYRAPLEEVEPGFLSILEPQPATITPASDGLSTGRRTALAKWLADPANPLTARVAVNRLWHHHFGVGIVPTPGDFGRMGQRPTHPELLDWLSAEFVHGKWSLKRIHRLMVTSSTYRQSSADRADGAKLDPLNRLLWRFRPQRLEAEAIRDGALRVSGLLNPALGGPSVKPPLPAGMPRPAGGWDVSGALDDHYRRSIYISVRRTSNYPVMTAFDMPETLESCSRRSHTITAPQALTLLNSEASLDWARAFAGRVSRRAGSNKTAQVEEAFRLAFSREPDPWEKDRALTFLNEQQQRIADRQRKKESVAAPKNGDPALDPRDGAALVDLCLALLNANEFVYRF